MLADISDFEALQTHATPQSDSVSVFNEVVHRDEGTRLIRVPVSWHIDQDTEGLFDVFEAVENTSAQWKGSFPSMDKAKQYIEICKTQLQQ